MEGLRHPFPDHMDAVSPKQGERGRHFRLGPACIPSLLWCFKGPWSEEIGVGVFA